MRVGDRLLTTDLRRKALMALRSDIVCRSPSNVLELLVAGRYQEPLASRIMEFAEDESLIVDTLDILKLICTRSECTIFVLVEVSPEFARNFFLEYSGSATMVTGMFSKNPEAVFRTIEIIFRLSGSKETLSWLDKSN